MENRNDVPYIVYESEMARLERIVHRSVILSSVSVIALVVTNALWFTML